MRRLALIATLLAAGAAALAATAGADRDRTYVIEMYNAFGIVPGSDVRVAGVNAGSVSDLDINAEKNAEITVELSGELAELGDETTCSSEPQSLIAEYFIDCDPAGAPLPEGGMVPAERVAQTVQPDLVQTTLREPYMRRFHLLINEFGTALAGNPERLNEAVRLGAPALTQLREATRILANQRRVIRGLNENSDRIMAELAEHSEEVVRFVQAAERTGRVSASRREDLSRNFEILDDFLAELQPALGALEELATEQTPLLHDLRASAPELNRLALNLPPFNRASEEALATLGEAGVVGERALRKGRGAIRLLARAGRNAPVTATALADLLRDLDDPRRAVEIDERAGEDTGRTGTQPGRPDTMGYTGLEGLLNYLYYITLASNQFDRINHLVHFSLYGVFTGPCGAFHTGRNPQTGEPGVPKEGGGTTTDILEAAKCVRWLGPNQPGINEDLNLDPYHPSVCRDGVDPEPARALCDPGALAQASDDDDAERGSGSARTAEGGAASPRDGSRAERPNGEAGAGGPLAPLGGRAPGEGGGPQDLLDFLLGGGSR